MTLSLALDSILDGFPPFITDEEPPTAEGLILLGLAQLNFYEWAC